METPQTLPGLPDYLAHKVSEAAGDLVERWIAAVAEHVGPTPATRLPREAIRDHMPTVVREIAESLRTPLEVRGVDAILRTHARLRRDQGFDVRDVIAEYRILDRIVSDYVQAAMAEYPGEVDAREAASTIARLYEAFARVTERMLAMYRESELRHQRELHRQLEDYVRTITHELKQPLHAIASGTGMLEQEGLVDGSGRGARYLRIIREGTRRALALIEDVRMLAFLEEAQHEREWRPIDAAVDTVLREMREPARRKGVRLEVVHPLPSIEVDSARVEIALVNLVSNAIKYSDPEKEERWVRIEVEPENDAQRSWRVRVTDNGLGLADFQKPHVFERHYRAHPEVGEGTGLGLAITRQIVEQGGGSMGFESDEGTGSSFWFTVVGHPHAASAEP